MQTLFAYFTNHCSSWCGFLAFIFCKNRFQVNPTYGAVINIKCGINVTHVDEIADLSN